MTPKNIIFWTLVIALTAFPGYMLFYKLYIAKLPMESLIPDIIYQVETQIDLEGYGNDVNVSVYLPKNDSRQQIFSEQSSNTNFTLAIPADELNRQASWTGTTIQGFHNLRYSYSVKASHVQYKIPPDLSIPKQYPSRLDPYLAEEEGVQVNDNLIGETLFSTLRLPAEPKILEALSEIHNHLQNNLENRTFSG